MSKKLSVLLIDDDSDDQLFFEMAISELDFPVEYKYANNGLSALGILNKIETLPDFIFLDINMPKMNGLECLKKIKQTKKLKDIPVYMYSTSAEKYVEQDFIKHGAAGMIKKETCISDICESLISLFEEKLAST